MSLASRISDLTNAIAAAVNARSGKAGASAYEIAVINGYTGTQAQWLVEFQDTSNTDYAALFNSQLGTVPYTGLATEAQSGVTQLSTLAEALAGTSSTKALSALRYANVVIATTLADLNSKVGSLPAGSLVGLAAQDFGTNRLLYRSLWYVAYGSAVPAIPLVVSNSATLTYLVGQIGSGKTYTTIGFDPFVTDAYVYRNFGTDSQRDIYRYIGTTTNFLLWQGAFQNWSWQGTAQNRGTGGTSTTTGPTRITVAGEQVHIALAGNGGSSGVAQFNIILTMTSEVQPLLQDAFMGGAINSNGWQSHAFYVSLADSTLRPLSAGIGANIDFGMHGSYRRVIPTV